MKRSTQEVEAFTAVRAAEMKRWPTNAEEAMWAILEPLGFERQVPITVRSKNGGWYAYILDFFHTEKSLCVEVDGGVHSRTKGRDRRRDTRLANHGIRTLRFTNSKCLKHPDHVRAEVVEALGEV